MKIYRIIIFFALFLGISPSILESAIINKSRIPTYKSTRDRNYTYPNSQSLVLAKDIVGIELQWEQSAKNVSSKISAVRDFDLKNNLPRNSTELLLLIQSRAGKTTLPLLLNNTAYFSTYNFEGNQLFLTSLEETATGLLAEIVFSVNTPENKVFNFTGNAIPFTGSGKELCSLMLPLEGDETNNDFEFPIIVKGGSSTDSVSFVQFNCDGIDNFHLFCEYLFPIEKVTLPSGSSNNVRGRFKMVSSQINDFIGPITVDSFEMVGLDDIKFTVQEAFVDYSSSSNHSGMMNKINQDWATPLKEKYQDNTWRGIYFKNFSIELPEGIKNATGKRIKINVVDFVADHGTGITGNAINMVSDSGNISGWAFTVANLDLGITNNSVNDFEMTGKINIPLLTGVSSYQAILGNTSGAPNVSTSICFNLDLDGEYHIPMFNNSLATLSSSSIAEINLVNGSYQPFAKLQGVAQPVIQTPSLKLPGLSFQDLKVNDMSMQPVGSTPGQVTGGLDRVSALAFGFGGGLGANDGGSIGYVEPNFPFYEEEWHETNQFAFGPNGGGMRSYELADYQMVDTTGQQPQDSTKKSLNGFPITIRDFNFGTATENGKSYYKLSATIGINLAKGVRAFEASGGFGIWAGFNFDKILTKKPWEALYFHKLGVEKITIGADLGPVAIAGGIRIIDNDPIYGNGFKGGIKMRVKLGATEIMVNSVAQFGNIDGNEDFRYFFIDAEAGMNPGITLGPTGLAIYGFTGGFFYNMSRNQSSDAEMAALAASKDISTMPANDTVLMVDDLLTPGVSLSGLKYYPQKNNTSFNAGLIFGFVQPNTLLADVSFGMDINTSDFAVRSIFLRGGAYMLNKGIANRRNAVTSVQAMIEYDFQNNCLSARFGMKFELQLADTNLTLIKGAYNTNLNAINACFKFSDPKDFFILAGKPNDPIRVDFQLTRALKLYGLKAYFMVATGGSMPRIPSISEVFTEEGYTIPNELNGITQRPFLMGDKGVAFGARLGLPRKEYSFLMFKATLGAFAGFDASLMHFDDPPQCGNNGTFGFNNWYIQGQAYGAFTGALSMEINLSIYKGSIKIFDIEAGAGLKAQLPNPTFLAGFVYGRYNILSGAIKGKFSFKIKIGEACEGLIDNPLASIPIIEDLKPENNKTEVEVYTSPAATFFLPMNKTIDVPFVTSSGEVQDKRYTPYIKASKLIKVNGNTEIPHTIKYQDSNRVAVFQTRFLLDQQTNYKFTVTVGWKEIVNGQTIISTIEEVKSVSFKSGNKPAVIVPEAIAYHAPGLKQRHWNKDYAIPKLEFAQQGWNNLFPRTKNISFYVNEQNVATAFQNAGWQTSRSGSRYLVQKNNVNLKYIARITNLSTGQVNDIRVNETPEEPVTEYIPTLVEKTVKIYGITIMTYWVLENVPYSITGTTVGFNDLKNFNFEKNKIYSLNIIRAIADSIPIPVATKVVENTSSYTYNDTLEVLTTETSKREITALDSYRDVIKQQIGDYVLYTYHFGTSKFNTLKDKFNALSFGQFKIGGTSKNKFDYPDENVLDIGFTHGSRDMYYPMPITNNEEDFDYFDKKVLLTNLEFRTGQNEGNNPVYDKMVNRKITNLLWLPGGTLGINETMDNESDEIKRWINEGTNLDRTRQLNYSERYTNQIIIPNEIYDRGATVSILNSNRNISIYWSNKINQDESSVKVAKDNYRNFFLNKVLFDFYANSLWRNNIHFNTKSKELLTDAEITAKIKENWNPSGNVPVDGLTSYPANNLIWIQNNDARIIRNTLQLYIFHAKCLQLIEDKTTSRNNDFKYLYRAVRWYYDYRDNNVFSRVKNDLYTKDGNPKNQILNKKVGLVMKYSSVPPIHMFKTGNLITPPKAVNMNTSNY